MDAALEVVLALGEVVDLQFAALQHARFGDVDIVKAFSHGTFGSSRLAAFDTGSPSIVKPRSRRSSTEVAPTNKITPNR